MRLSQLLSEFLSTPSGWRATVVLVALFPRCFNFYPRPPGGGRLSHSMFPRTAETISIHALRVEGDRWMRSRMNLRARFLSTPSGWRATISIPPVYARGVISIHALRVEGDLAFALLFQCSSLFLSTPSGWRATLALCFQRALTYIISIHALRVEGDSKNGQNFRLFLRKREKNLPL